MSKVSDAEIISVLLVNGCNKSATARSLGISRRTIQNRFNDADFVIEYEDAVKARDRLIKDLSNTATVKALEFIIDTLDADTSFDFTSYMFGGVTRQDQMKAATVALGLHRRLSD